jgi:hypothetical protein
MGAVIGNHSDFIANLFDVENYFKDSNKYHTREGKKVVDRYH